MFLSLSLKYSGVLIILLASLRNGAVYAELTPYELGNFKSSGIRLPLSKPRGNTSEKFGLECAAFFLKTLRYFRSK